MRGNGSPLERRPYSCLFLFLFFRKLRGIFCYTRGRQCIGRLPPARLRRFPGLDFLRAGGMRCMGSGQKRMRRPRFDAWTPEEDRLLAEIVLSSVRRGKTQKAGIEEAAKRLNRSFSAASYRWNRFVRKEYEQELSALRRKVRSKSTPPPLTSVSWDRETLSSFLENLQRIAALLDEVRGLLLDLSSSRDSGVSDKASPSGASAEKTPCEAAEKGRRSLSRRKSEKEGERRPVGRRAKLDAGGSSPKEEKRREPAPYAGEGGREKKGAHPSPGFSGRAPGPPDEKADALIPILEALRDLED